MRRFLPQCLAPSFQVYIWGILLLGRMGSVFVCLVGFGEREMREILNAAVVSLFQREVHFLFIMQNNRKQNIKCHAIPDLLLNCFTAADN